MEIAVEIPVLKENLLIWQIKFAALATPIAQPVTDLLLPTVLLVTN
jgi:hypothetical protein